MSDPSNFVVYPSDRSPCTRKYLFFIFRTLGKHSLVPSKNLALVCWCVCHAHHCVLFSVEKTSNATRWIGAASWPHKDLGDMVFNKQYSYRPICRKGQIVLVLGESTTLHGVLIASSVRWVFNLSSEPSRKKQTNNLLNSFAHYACIYFTI